MSKIYSILAASVSCEYFYELYVIDFVIRKITDRAVLDHLIPWSLIVEFPTIVHDQWSGIRNEKQENFVHFLLEKRW